MNSALVCAAALVLALPSRAGASLPEIRTGKGNAVPACATPDRLMRFVETRTPRLDQRFRNLAEHYRRHGKALRVRWDYAFFQMLVETNFLTFRRPSGAPSDVSAAQNNFAGMGATGGGEPGDSYKSPSMGVRAQLEHLVVYSGERLDNPVAPRTRLKMDEILGKSQALGRSVTFADLSGRWAIDRNYGRTIEGIAQSFYGTQCDAPARVARAEPQRSRPAPQQPPRKIAAATAPRTTDDDPPPPAPQKKSAVETKPAVRELPPQTLGAATISSSVQREASQPEQERKPAAAETKVAAAAGAPNVAKSAPPPAAGKGACKVLKARFAESGRTVLLESRNGETTILTALGVSAEDEAVQTKAYVEKHARGGKSIGSYPSEDAALRKAFQMCPSG